MAAGTRMPAGPWAPSCFPTAHGCLVATRPGLSKSMRASLTRTRPPSSSARARWAPARTTSSRSSCRRRATGSRCAATPTRFCAPTLATTTPRRPRPLSTTSAATTATRPSHAGSTTTCHTRTTTSRKARLSASLDNFYGTNVADGSLRFSATLVAVHTRPSTTSRRAPRTRSSAKRRQGAAMARARASTAPSLSTTLRPSWRSPS